MRKLKNSELNRISAEEYKTADKTPVVIVLDNVRSLYNVGSVFRTADAFRVEQICLCGITGKPPHPEIHKSALGATDAVDWIHYSETIDCIKVLKLKGYTIVAIEQAEGSIDLQNFKPDTEKKYAFIFGNEIKGVSDDIMESLDMCIEIPQFGSKHSFNIAVSTGIVMWHYFNNQTK
ncbi:MAG: RNA methyltransferase [Bacteroidales bacterium]|nr:RNA methyltransferase [Bacteroidales bacterium]